MRTYLLSRIVVCAVPLWALGFVSSVQADQVIQDDLIVVGSACVGGDCVNGEDFGFDTIRLKENNLRINFNDTSVGSFPTNNWQLRANSSASGGSNFLGFVDQGASGTSETGTIVFQVEAGAGADALKVRSGGNVGFGTSDPVVKAHLVNGNTPTLRLDQNGSSGFTPQVWDIAGNEVNFFVRDATNGARLPFRIQPNAPTNSIFVAATKGNVGFGTSSPTAAVHVQRNTNASEELLKLANDAPVQLTLHNTDHANPWTMNHSNAGNLVFNSADTMGPEFEILAAGGIRVGGTNMNVPDYVFEKDYKLRSINELSSFIRKNGHLPGVISAREVAANGAINVTDLQMQMLEKIEELTLYTIRQQEDIESLKSDSNKQRKVNQELTSRLAAIEDATD